MKSFAEKIYNDVIVDDRYMYLVKGFGNTLLITLFAVLLGIMLGFLVAIIRSSHDRMDRPGIVMKILNFICNVYLTIIRGTPTMVQILIMYFIVFSSAVIPKLLVAVLTFGINSGAYVAEIVRS